MISEVGAILERFWVGMALHLWQSTIVLVVLAGIGLGLRRAPARYHDALAWLAWFKLLVPLSLLAPLVTGGLQAFGATRGVLARGRLTEYVGVVFEPVALTAHVGRGFDIRFLFYLALTLVWGAGVSTLLWKWRRLARTRIEGARVLREVSERTRQRVEAAIDGTRLPAESIRIVEGNCVPSLHGLLRPTVLISRATVESLAEQELRAVLLHEDAHRRRLDNWRATLLRLVLAVFFFYPPVWWLVARLRAAAELACDEIVLARGIPAPVYSRALARVLAGQLGLASWGLPVEAALGRRGDLRHRLDQIENAWRYRVMNRHRVLALMAVLCVTGSFLVPAVSTGTSEPAAGSEATEPHFPAELMEQVDRLALDPNPMLLEYRDTPLAKVFEQLENRAGVRFEGAGRLEQPVSVAYGEVTARQALLRLAMGFGLNYDVVDPWHVRVTRPDPLLAGLGDVGHPVRIEASYVEPVYTEDAREDKIEASIILHAIIQRDGSVGQLQVLRSSRPDYPSLAESAQEAVRQWRYEPARQNGKPVAVYFTIVIEYKLR